MERKEDRLGRWDGKQALAPGKVRGPQQAGCGVWPDLLVDIDGLLILLQLCGIASHLQQTLVG